MSTPVAQATLKVGQDNYLNIRLVDDAGDPIKLTGAAGLTEITCHLPQTTGGPLSLTKTAGDITVLDGEAGRLQVRISQTNTATLKSSKTLLQSFEVFVDTTVASVSNRKVARFDTVLAILPALL